MAERLCWFESSPGHPERRPLGLRSRFQPYGTKGFRRFSGSEVPPFPSVRGEKKGRIVATGNTLSDRWSTVSGSRIDRGLGIGLGVLPRIWPSRFISTTPTREEAPSRRSERQTRVEPALGSCFAVYLITQREGRKRADRRTGGQNERMGVLLDHMNDFSGWCRQMEAQDPGHPGDAVPA